MILLLVSMLADTASTTATPLPVDEKIICKREAVTGSLARFHKICRTGAQWRVAQNQVQDDSRALQERGLINSEAPR